MNHPSDWVTGWIILSTTSGFWMELQTHTAGVNALNPCVSQLGTLICDDFAQVPVDKRS